MSTAEEWLPVAWPDGYEVSNLGRVRNARTGLVLSLLRHNDGYLNVKLGRKRREYVHRLVCEAFNGPPPRRYYHADHRDFDRTNNTPGNLRWLPPSLNEWRWKGSEWDIADDYDPMSAAEADQIDAELEAAGW